MDTSKLTEEVLAYCEKNRIQGMLRVTLKDEIVFRLNVGFEDIENQIPFSEETMFTLYSLSKPFCAIGLMKLVDRGLVELSAHPAKYVPEAEGLDARVTICHLLHHTSGIPDFEQNSEFNEKYAPGYPSKIREHLKLLTAYPSYFAPGTGARYANVNFVLCALVIENVTGLSYREYMTKEVLLPLGMKHAVVDDETMEISHRAKGYLLMDDEKLAPVNKSHSWLLGAGDLVATVDDVYCLNLAIKHKRILSEAAWTEILTPSPLNSMGKGCTLSEWHGKKRITHNGGHIGFRTLHIQLPEDDFDIIFLSNSGFGEARRDLAEIIHAAFYENLSPGEEIQMDKGYI